MSLLIVGGAGYVGSHVANWLHQNNHSVIVYDNLSTGFKNSLHPEITFKQGDLLDKCELQQVFQQNKIEAVFHLAALLNIKESFAKPLNYYRVNVLGLINLMQVCEEHSVQKLIFSSSSTVYGNISNDQLNETDPIQPINPYGHTKMIAERLIQDFSKLNSFQYKILRYFNVAGAADDNLNGQRTQKAHHLIHLATKAALGVHDRMQIYGSNYSTADGSCVRDYIHVQDLAELHLLAYENLADTSLSQILNCGYGKGFSVKEVLQTMNRIAPNPFKIISAERRAGDPDHLVASTKLLMKTLPFWKPQRNNLELICQSALRWEAKLSNG